MTTLAQFANGGDRECHNASRKPLEVLFPIGAGILRGFFTPSIIPCSNPDVFSWGETEVGASGGSCGPLGLAHAER